uniref:START domain-containing protein n=1 Tax=Phytophthora ramorum TaxID=164328 RepID=H3H3D0_PHYRM
MKERYTINPFPDLTLTDGDRTSLEDLANAYIMTNLDLCMKFMDSGRKVDPRRWKPLKQKKGLKIYSERPDSVGTATADEATGAGLPTILCVGTKEGKLDDLMFGIISEDLETMRMKASYADSFSAAAVLDGVVMPSLEDPFQSLVVKWMELDIPFNSTGLIKNRDYIYLEGIGIVKNAAGERFGYSLLHSVNFPQTHALPNRVRGNISFIAYWRQINNNTMEMYATGIIDPVDDGLVRKLVLPVVATLFLGSLDYVFCGQMRKLSYMLERRYEESKTRGAPNKKNACVTCSAPITGRRLGDFGKSNSTCKTPYNDERNPRT